MGTARITREDRELMTVFGDFLRTEYATYSPKRRNGYGPPIREVETYNGRCYTAWRCPRCHSTMATWNLAVSPVTIECVSCSYKVFL